MEQLLHALRTEFKDIRFTAGKSFCWSPATQEVFYPSKINKPSALWSLLHETGHALLGHQDYVLDFELIELEVAAWQKAKELAKRYDITIDTNHIEDCLDSYRDWLHRRSICPDCHTQALQLDKGAEYHCHNCRMSWQVAPSRFCRPYRSTSKTKSSAIFAVADDSLKLTTN